MAKMLEALTTIERGANEKTIERGTVFSAKDQEQEDQLFRLQAVREYAGAAQEGMKTSPDENPTAITSGTGGDNPELAAATTQLEEAEGQLRTRYQELYGSKPHANMKFDTIRARVAEKDAGFEAVKLSEEAEVKIAELTAATDDGKNGSDAAEAGGDDTVI